MSLQRLVEKEKSGGAAYYSDDDDEIDEEEEHTTNGCCGGTDYEEKNEYRIQRARKQYIGKRLNRAIFDMLSILLFYFAGGTVFYYYANKEFTLTYSFFYAINLGFGVGYGELHARDVFVKYCTVGYILIGTPLVFGALHLIFQKSLQLTYGQVSGMSRLLWSAFLYVSAVALGIWLAVKFENSNSFADALLFATSNYQTSGLILPREHGLLWVTISLLIGCPANALLAAEVTRIIFHGYEDDATEDARQFMNEQQGEHSTASSLWQNQNYATSRLSLSPTSAQQQGKSETDREAYCAFLEDALVRNAVYSPATLVDIRTSFFRHPRDNHQSSHRGTSRV